MPAAIGAVGAEIVVVGAGAAGLWAAERAARAVRERGRTPDVLLLEKTPRAGTKVLASGGTRCNLTTTLGPDEAARLFGRRAERFLRRAFRELPPTEVRARFAAWGVPTVEAPLEKIFPSSGRARDVRDALVDAAVGAGVRLVFGAGVVAIARMDDAWEVRLADGTAVRTRRLLLAPGGKSYPRTGTTGDGYDWLRSLDLELVEPVPALVPLASPAAWVHALTGIALQETEVRLRDTDGRIIATRRRPVLFTHEGLSGPGPMDVSGEVARAAASAPGPSGSAPSFSVALDLLPGVSREELVVLLRDAAGRAGSPRIAELLPGPLPRRLIRAVCETAGLPETPRANQLTRATRHALIEALKGLAVPIQGTCGFDRAEVTAGGLALGELDPATLGVRGREGLYVFGELIDVDGPIGGLNFQAAFATAELAARSASA